MGTWDHQRIARRRLLRSAGVAGAGLAGVALIGCSDDDEPNGTPSNGTPTPAPTDSTPTPVPDPGEATAGGRLGGSTTSTSNFNPINNGIEGFYLSGTHVYDRLISSRPDERVYEPEAVESVELPDDTTVIFRLREGLVFQDLSPVDGRAVDAEDVVASQHYSRDSEEAHNNSFQVNGMESVEATDERTVVFHLTRSNAYLFSGTQLGHPGGGAIIPQEMLDDLDTLPPVGSGPYQLAEHQLGTRYLYERNPTYWDADEGRPYIDERQMLILDDPAAIETAFRSEQVQANPNGYIPPSEIGDRLEADLSDELTIEEYLALNMFTWTVSREREPWNDERVREAIYRLFDSQQFTDLVDSGRAVPCPGTISAGLTAYQVDEADTAEFWRHDPEEARALLEAAGFDFDRQYELVTLAGGRTESGVQVMQRQLEQGGIQTGVSIYPIADYLGPILGQGNYDVSVNTHPAYDTPQLALRWHHSNPQVIIASASLGDPEIDALIEETETTLDFDEQSDLVKALQIELLSRYPALAHINSLEAREFRWAYVRDWEINPAPFAMFRTEAWLDI